ncbi:hypothetical protein Hanom_Chr03g00265481 [Helianthus anomalus]
MFSLVANFAYGFVVVHLWRIFVPDSKVKINTEQCGEDKEGWYQTTVGNFCVPDLVALRAPLPTRLSKWWWEKGAPNIGAVTRKAAKAKRLEKHVTIAVKQASSGTFCPIKTQSEDYVLVSDTLEGLDMLGSTSSAGGTGASTGSLIGKKRKVEIAPAGAVPKKIFIRRGKITKLGARLAQPTKVATTTTLPPPPSPPCKPTGDEKKAEEPEQTIQVESRE